MTLLQHQREGHNCPRRTQDIQCAATDECTSGSTPALLICRYTHSEALPGFRTPELGQRFREAAYARHGVKLAGQAPQTITVLTNVGAEEVRTIHPPNALFRSRSITTSCLQGFCAFAQKCAWCAGDQPGRVHSGHGGRRAGVWVQDAAAVDDSRCALSLEWPC